MISKQTKENLSRVVLQVLDDFGLSIDQIFAVAHDNGANMCASVPLLISLSKPVSEEEVSLSNMLPDEFDLINEYKRDNHQEVDDSEETENEIDTTNRETEKQSSDDFDEEETADNQSFEDTTEELEILNSIRYGAHTAQLVAYDIIKLHKTRLAHINKICLTMPIESSLCCTKSHYHRR